MDRSRRASHASLGGNDEDRARKRRRQSSDSPSVRAAVQEVFDAVWNHQERNRNIRQDFEELPSREDYPDYYEKIDNPISLAEIQAKLDQYESIDAIKKDMFLMLDNATVYNKSKSRVYNDALRLRSIVDRFIDEQPNARPRRGADVAGTPSRSSTRGSRPSASAMKDVQLALIEEMWNLKDEDGELVSFHFRQLPPKRDYPDYYKVIENPISLSMIRTKAREGAYTSWADFEAAVHLITANAEEYNDENSEIVRDARALEKNFLERLHQERAKLGDLNSGIKLRLNPSGGQAATPTSTPRIKLNVGRGGASTPNGSSRRTRLQTPSGASPGRSASPISVQTRASAASPVKNQSPVKAPPIHQAPALSRSASSTSHTSVGQGQPMTNGLGIHHDTRSQTPQSQHTGGYPPAMSPPATMPPPLQHLSVTPRPGSYSPAPSGSTPVPQQHQQSQYAKSMYQYDEPRFRPEGQDPSTYLITSLRMTSTSPIPVVSTASNPSPGPAVFQRTFSPSSTTVTTQYTITVPSHFSTITLTPTLSTTLTSRPYRISVEWKYHQQQGPPKPISQGRGGTKDQPEYEIRLVQGVVNTVECMVVTQANRTGVLAGWEMERFRLFVHVLA